jgi:hypothetical protein
LLFPLIYKILNNPFSYKKTRLLKGTKGFILLGVNIMGNDSKRDLCSEFARILDGDASFMNGVCLVQRFRDIPFKILGRRTNSPLVNPHFFTFENLDSKGNALNLGVTVLLLVVVNPLLTE